MGTPETLKESQSTEERLDAITKEIDAHLSCPSGKLRERAVKAYEEIRALGAGARSTAGAEALLLISRALFMAGHGRLALEPCAKAVEIARATGDQALQRRALTFRGNILYDTSNIAGAMECHGEALELAIALEQDWALPVVWLNISAALVAAGEYEKAIASAKRAFDVAHGSTPEQEAQATLALGNIALAALRAKQFEQGLEAARQYEANTKEPETTDQLVQRVNFESTYVRLLLETQRLDEAKEHVALAQKYAQRSLTERCQLVASMTQGLWEVFAGLGDIGFSRLNQVLELSRNVPSFRGDTLISLARAHEACGNNAKALTYLREFIHAQRKQQHEAALHEHRLHLELLGVPAEEKDAEKNGRGKNGLDRARFSAALEALQRQAIAAELVEDQTGLHVFRVGKLAGLLGQETGLDDDTCFVLTLSCRLHDIGKIAVPAVIMASADRLTEQKLELVRTHCNSGAELLAQAGLSNMEMAIDVARHHHEAWDGSGYPDGLAGGAIPAAARIAALADVYDVLTHGRPYRTACSPAEALMEIRRMKGTRFDPAMVEAFVGMVERLLKEHEDLDAFLARDAPTSTFIMARSKIDEALASMGRQAAR